MSAPATPDVLALAPDVVVPPEVRPNIENLVTEDGKPVDSIYSEKQMRLLTGPLFASWAKTIEPRTFVAMANVGMFYADEKPPLVPDVLLSLDVKIPDSLAIKQNRSYFFWKYGKPPEIVIEVVSNNAGEELGAKKALYGRIGILYYVVWDPLKILGPEKLQCFLSAEREYKKNGPWFPAVGLGLKEWDGTFEDKADTWLRWCDRQGQLIPTGSEQADQESRRAEQERSRAEQLAAQLRSLGIEPDIR